MKAIAAVDRNWGIGLKGKLLVQIPADQRFFREKTTGQVVVMGRKTLESFPGGSPLKNRVNVVLTRGNAKLPDEVEVAHSIEELRSILSAYDGSGSADEGEPEREIYCIGGAEVYKQLLPMCDECIITKIDESYEADAFFPDLDKDPEWELVRDGSENEEHTYFDVIYHFLRYRRKH